MNTSKDCEKDASMVPSSFIGKFEAQWKPHGSFYEELTGLTTTKHNFGYTKWYLEDEQKVRYPFVVLCSYGIKGELGPHVCTYNTPEEAVSAYMVVLRNFVNGASTVYWRRIPTIETVETNGKISYVVSSLLTATRIINNTEVKLFETKKESEPEMSNEHCLGWRTEKGPNQENTSGFRALGARVLLLPEEVKETTQSGIILSAKTVQDDRNKAVIATVVEIGCDCWADQGADYCKVGDRVLIGQYVGKFHESPVDGKIYRFVSDLDIISTLPEI